MPAARPSPAAHVTSRPRARRARGRPSSSSASEAPSCPPARSQPRERRLDVARSQAQRPRRLAQLGGQRSSSTATLSPIPTTAQPSCGRALDQDSRDLAAREQDVVGPLDRAPRPPPRRGRHGRRERQQPRPLAQHDATQQRLARRGAPAASLAPAARRSARPRSPACRAARRPRQARARARWSSRSSRRWRRGTPSRAALTGRAAAARGRGGRRAPAPASPRFTATPPRGRRPRRPAAPRLDVGEGDRVGRAHHVAVAEVELDRMARAAGRSPACGSASRSSSTSATATSQAIYAATFADVAPGELLVYEDAYRTLALAVNRGSARRARRSRSTHELRIRPA